MNSVRALRDPEYRNTQATKVSHPAGLQELEDAALTSITGGCAGVPGCTGGGNPFASNPLVSCVGPGSACP